VSLAAQFGFDVEGVGAVEVDVVVLRGCQVRRVFVGDGIAVGAQGVERVAEVGRGPQDRGVGDEVQAEGLVDLVVEVAATDVALVGEEQVAAQCVQRRSGIGRWCARVGRIPAALGRASSAGCWRAAWR
jgi:hypothetical protein